MGFLTRSTRRATLPVLAFALCAALAALALPPLAKADSASGLTVVGTSDVSDSGLIANVIQPMFNAAYPQYTFKYMGTATGTAISEAESGSVGASVLIVHAPSLENQFVAGGYSYEPYGRAIFLNDFVLAGPKGDPAGVSANAGHDIVQAFADIATAGINGGGSPLITLMSRTGSPGTVVEEHEIWALVGAMPNPPAGLLLCTVSVASGGGETPIAAHDGVTASGQACPGTVTPPDWYQINNATQGPNVVMANACTGVQSPANSCYVLTDRGTYDSLAAQGVSSGNNPAGAIPNLTILTRNNSASAPGGAYLLVNYFHAYIINPAKPNEPVNLAAAEDFVNLLTSPALQSQLKNYLEVTTDTGGPPFVADASPVLTAAGFPSVDPAGTPVTITGSLTNVEPGFPALAGKTVTIDEIEGGLPVPVASGTTDSNGNYSITFTPSSSGSYQAATGQISQIEIPTLSPVYGDLLSPAATTPTSVSVQGAIAITLADPFVGGLIVSGGVSPAAPDGNATVTIVARPNGSTSAFTQVGAASLGAGQSSFTTSASLYPGTWQIEAVYADTGQLRSVTSGALVVTIPGATATTAAASTAHFQKVTIKHGALTVDGKVNPAATASGGHVELFAVRTRALKSTVKKARLSGPRGHAAAASLEKVATISIGTGKSSFTVHAKLARGSAWLLQLDYVQPQAPTTYSGLRTVQVR